MQLSSAASAPRVTTPRSEQPFSAQGIMPIEMQQARIGRGTVASEVDRTIRVRLEGDGPASTAKLVPDSAAAALLLADPEHGPKLDRALRSFLKEADGYTGKQNLSSITLTPDEHASKGATILNWVDSNVRRGRDVDTMIRPTEYQVGKVRKEHPEYSRAEIRGALRSEVASGFAQYLAADEPSNVSFAAAWNGDGNIIVTPDVSRELLASVGLYRIQPGDEATKLPRAARPWNALNAWETLVHETNHSISPSTAVEEPEHTAVFEEAIAEVLGMAHTGARMRDGGGDPMLLARPARTQNGLAVDWTAWNRDHLPQPPKEKVATAQGRYFDGPTLVKQLLHLAKVDRRTTEGKARTADLLQGETSAHVPKRLAEAIAQANGLAPSKVAKLADIIREAAVGQQTIGDVEDFVGA